MTTPAQYESQIGDIAIHWRARADDLIAKGWRPDFAFEEAANKVANIGKLDEATIVMMTRAAGHLLYDWQHSAEFSAWWNARYPDAPKLEGHDFAAPCFIDLPGGGRGVVAAPWSNFNHTFTAEKAQA